MREVMTIFAAGLFGLVFGLGLILSDMTDPMRVIGFLDVMGDWDPTLAFVMAGGIAVAAPAFFVARRGKAALLGEVFFLPNRLHIDRSLVLGSAIFGIGWGLAGMCPGPGIVLLGAMDMGGMTFVPAVIVGMFLARWRPPQMATSN